MKGERRTSYVDGVEEAHSEGDGEDDEDTRYDRFGEVRSA